MDRLAGSLEVLAVSGLNSVIAAARRLPDSTKVIGADAVGRLRRGAGSDGLAVRRLTVGRALQESAQLVLNVAGRVTLASRTLRTRGDLPLLSVPGDVVRYVPVRLPLMALDQDLALLGDSQPGVVVVRDKLAINTLTACHDLLWNATQLRIPVGDTEPLPEELGAIITELSAGISDTSAARNLHISERTMSRRMGELLEQLGATTRFQAGYLAARREMTAAELPETA